MTILVLDLMLLLLQVRLVVGLVPPMDARTRRNAAEIPCEFWNTKAGLTLIGALITGLALIIIALTVYLLLTFHHSLVMAQIKARRSVRSSPSNRPCIPQEPSVTVPDSPPSYNTIIRMDNTEPTVLLL